MIKLSFSIGKLSKLSFIMIFCSKTKTFIKEFEKNIIATLS